MQCKFILLPCVLIILLFTSSLRSAVNYGNINNLSEYLVLVSIKKYSTDNTSILYADAISNEYYLSFDEFVKIVDFNITSTNLTAKGDFFNGKTLDINLNYNRIVVNRRKISFSPADIKISDNSMYFSLDLLQKVFDISMKVNLSQLTLNIDSANTFPVELTSNKINNRSNNLKDYTNQKKSTYTMYDKIFSYPTLDVTLYHTWNEQNHTKRQSFFYDFTVGGTFLDLDTTLNYFTSDYDKLAKTNLTFSRSFPQVIYNNKLIRYFALGDISSSGNVLLNDSSYGRGIMVTSVDNYDISENKTITLRGLLASGWEVELYQNSALIAYRNGPNRDGYYEFKDIPVFNGINIFKLKFYGPFGETKEEIKKIIVGAAPVMAHEFAYNASLVQANHKTIENSKEVSYRKNYTNTNDKFDTNVNIYYGIFDNLAISAGYSKLNNINSAFLIVPDKEVKDINPTFYNSGLIFNLLGFTFKDYIAGRVNYNKYASYYSVDGNLFGLGQIYLSYNHYNGIKSAASYQGSLLMKDYLDARYNNYYRLLDFYLPVFIEYERHTYDTIIPLKDQELSIRTSHNIFNYFSLMLEYNYYKIQTINQYAVATLSTNYERLSLRGAYKEEIKPQLKPNSFNLYAGYSFPGLGFNIFAEVNRTFNNYNVLKDHTDYYLAGISQVSPIGKFALEYSGNKRHQYYVTLTYNISLAYNNDIHKLYFETDAPLVSYGGIFANVFIDNDNDGVYHKGVDTPITNAKLMINSSVSSKRSSKKDGVIFKPHLIAYSPIKVSIDPLSINDIMLIPEKKQYNLVLRPSAMQVLNFAFVRTGNIEGVIKNTSSNVCRFGKVLLINNNNKLIKQTAADEDGLFLLENVPYGNYIIHLLCGGKVVTITETPVDNDVNYVKLNLQDNS